MDSNKSDRTVRLETLIQVLTEKLVSIESKLDHCNDEIIGNKIKINDVRTDLNNFKLEMNRRLSELRKDLIQTQQDENDNNKNVNKKLEQLSKDSISFKSKLTMLGSLLVVLLGFVGTAFGSDISVFLSNFFGN